MISRRQIVRAILFTGIMALCSSLPHSRARANLISQCDDRVALSLSSIKVVSQAKDRNTESGDESLRRGDILYDDSRYKEAIKEYEKAVAFFNLIDEKTKLARVYLKIGKSYESLREYEEAAKWYRKVLDLARQADEITLLAAQNLDVVNNIIGFDSEAGSDKSDSQVIKAKRDSLFQEKGISLRELRYQALGLIFQGKAEEAIAMVDAGLKEYQAAKKPAPPDQSPLDKSELINRIGLQNVLALANFRLGRYDKSAEHLQALLAMHQAGNYQDGISLAYADLGFVYYSKREFSTAEKYLRQAISIQEKIELPEIWQTYHSLARLYEEQNRLPEAETFYKLSIDKIDTIRSDLITEETKMGLLSQAVQPFQNYTEFLLNHKTGPDYQLTALDISERSRARALSDLISRASKDQKTDDARAANKPITFGERYSPEHSKSWTGEQIIRFVAGGATVYLSFYVTANKTYACVINPSGELKWVALSPSSPELSKLVMQYRERTDSKSGGDEEESKKLFSYLIAPLLPLIKGQDKAKLTILPHGFLNLVPFSALPDEHGRPFGLDHDITYLPSFTIAGELTKLKVDEKDEMLLIGKPESTQGLLYSMDEVVGVSKVFGEKQSLILSGKAATKERVMTGVVNYSYLLFSTHGSADEKNTAVFHLALADGEKLTLNDINKLKLKAKLVVLSACQTHRGSLYSGDELISLSRSFLSSGAKYVLATLWEVEDRASSEIIQDFFALLKSGNSPAQSLRLAQLRYWGKQERDGEVNARRRRAHFWAPWILLGRNE